MNIAFSTESTHGNPNIFRTKQLEVISYIQISTSLLSVFGAGSVIFVALGKRKVRSKDVYPLFNLCLADLLASIFILSSALTYSHHSTAETISQSCAVTTGLATGFYVSSFSLSAIYAYEVYLRVKGRLQSRLSFSGHALFSRPCFQIFNLKTVCYIISWIVPVSVSVAMMVVIQDDKHPTAINDPCANYECLLMFHQQNDMCLNQTRLGIEGRNAAKTLFIVPLITAMVTILIIYISTFKLFRKVQKSCGLLTKKQHEAVRDVRNKGMMYSAVFTFCWIPSLVLGLVSFSDQVDVQSIYWLVVLQSLTATLQGFLNCVIYGWNRTNFTKELRRTANTGEDYTVRYTSSLSSNYGTLQDSKDVT